MTPRWLCGAVVMLGLVAGPAGAAAGPTAAVSRTAESAERVPVARAAGRSEATPAAPISATLASVPGSAPLVAVPGSAALAAVPGSAALASVPGSAALASAPRSAPLVAVAVPETVPAVPGAAFPAAVARAASQAVAPETVREPDSGGTFPLALTPPQSATPHWLMGTGIRQRTIFRVKVYAFGLYVDADAARTALADFAGATVEALRRDERFTRRLLDLDFGMALRLVMTRTVSGGDVADAFDEALWPRMPRAAAGADGNDAAAALARLRGYLDVDEVRRGAEIVFSCGPAGRLAMTVDGAERPPIESRALCRALFDVYLGDDPIERDGKRNALAGLAGLLQPVVRR